ncbi:MAG: hypothetical protein ACPGTO_01615 [Polaribacter sp.]
MSKKIKLIWDFNGEDSLEIAKHHCIHLKEFAEKEKLNYHSIEATQVYEYKAIAFIVVDEIEMKIYRDALKPHRGEMN